MRVGVCRALASVKERLYRFRLDQSGNIGIMFGLSATVLLVAVGSGVDLARAYAARQKLSEVATLACQYASRPSVVAAASPSAASGGGAAYSSNVNGFITSSLSAQHFGYSQTTATPFTYTQGGSADVTLTASVPTALMQVVRITQIPVRATSHCYSSTSTIAQKVPTPGTVLQEGFENSACSGTCYVWYSPTGQVGTVASPVNTPSSTIGYTGTSGAQWVTMGYCLEIDSVGVIKSTVPEGTHSAELDCDNGQGSAGNSSISSKTYLAAGNYEVRWNYISRVDYPNYDPVYICGSSASDVSWANDTAASGGFAGALRTNQINVYLDLNTSGVPPTHTTMDGAQTLGGSNLIDVCVYSTNWIERSVRIKVSTPGYYWLSLAADGKSDSYGGLVDNVRLCPMTCSGSLQDNFPTAWLNKTLFEDTFEAPSYSNGGLINYNGNLTTSYGTYNAGGTGGWPSAAALGWSVAPYNELAYILAYAAQGSQSIQLDGANSGGMSTTNRLVSRPFLLDPGYYSVSYNYASDALFSSLGANVYCGSTPSAAGVSSLTGTSASTARGVGTSLGTLSKNTNFVSLFMSHSLMASTPNLNGTLNSATTYANSDGTVTTTPKVAPDSISLTAYNPAQVNPLLDICGYASSWQTRTATILIQKPGLYWLTFSSTGSTADGYGGSIDDVKLVGLGSPYMASPPSSAVTIPVPNPQAGATTSFTGFSIISDPLTAPAPLQ